MIINVTDPNKEETPPPLSIAEELLAAIKLAKEEFKSCEVVIDLRKATKFLTSLSYKLRPYKDGVLLNFEKANIYIHDFPPKPGAR